MYWNDTQHMVEHSIWTKPTNKQVTVYGSSEDSRRTSLVPDVVSRQQVVPVTAEQQLVHNIWGFPGQANKVTSCLSDAQVSNWSGHYNK